MPQIKQYWARIIQWNQLKSILWNTKFSLHIECSHYSRLIVDLDIWSLFLFRLALRLTIFLSNHDKSLTWDWVFSYILHLNHYSYSYILVCLILIHSSWIHVKVCLSMLLSASSRRIEGGSFLIHHPYIRLLLFFFWLFRNLPTHIWKKWCQVIW